MNANRMPRRPFLKTSVASLAAPLLLRVPAASAGASAIPAQTASEKNTLKAGNLTAVIGDNSADGEHRSGYNGVWSLQHASGSRSIFVPAVAGLNLEHIVTGEHLNDQKLFFEPRNSPMTLLAISETEAELHQPPTPTYHVESWTRFTLTAPHYLDMSFRCIPRKPVFSYGYLALFWASYMHAPQDKSMYIRGGLDGQSNLWSQFCTQWHNDQSTVLHRNDHFQMNFDDGSRDALFRNYSKLRYDQPFFYGNCDDLIWLVMFDRTEGIRLTHSPSGGGTNERLQTTNPAWDFQFLIQEPQVDSEYGFHVRTALRPRCSREEILQEFEQWSKETR